MPQPNKSQVVELRKDPVVKMWIANYRKSESRYSTCRYCGWPHSEVLQCGLNSTFGQALFGGRIFYIDASNVEYMLGLVASMTDWGHSWRDRLWFRVDNGDVIITRVDEFNGHPNINHWRVSVEDWKSIVVAVDVGMLVK